MCPPRKPWLAPILSAVVVIVMPGGTRSQPRGKRAHQHLVSIGIDVNLLASECDRKASRMRAEFAASLLGGRRDFLLRRQHHFANVLLGGFLDADFLRAGFLFRRRLHLSDFYIQLPQTILDVRQAAIGI